MGCVETREIDNKFVAKTQGLTQYTHVLHPRTTGFVHLIKAIRASIDAGTSASAKPIEAVYDVTYAQTFSLWAFGVEEVSEWM